MALHASNSSSLEQLALKGLNFEHFPAAVPPYPILGKRAPLPRHCPQTRQHTETPGFTLPHLPAWGWCPNFEYTYSAEKARDTTVDDEKIATLRALYSDGAL